MGKTIFPGISGTKAVKMEGESKEIFSINWKLKILTEDLHLSLYNNTGIS